MTATLSNDYDDFLFAPIADDAAGMPLTMLTTLARLDLDPWEEAASLVRLPRVSATVRLEALLAVPPNGSTPHADSATTAGRLVKLLHEPTAKRARSATAPQPTAATPARRISKNVYYLLALVFMLIGLWAMALGQPRIAPNSDAAPVPAAS